MWTGDSLTYGGFGFDYTRKTGRFNYCMKIIERDIKLNPTDGEGYMQKAFIHYMLGEKETAVDMLEIYDPLYQDNYFYLMESIEQRYLR